MSNATYQDNVIKTDLMPIKGDSIWAESTFPNPLVTMDWNKDGELISISVVITDGGIKFV